MTSVPPPSGPAPPADGPPEGWYQDPQGTGLRWWDGRSWTEHTHEAAPPEGTTPEPSTQEDPDPGLTIGLDDDEEQALPAQPDPGRSEGAAPAVAPAAAGSAAGVERAEPLPSDAPPAAAATTEPAAAIPSGPGATTNPGSGSPAGGLRQHARLLVLLAILVVVLIVALVAGAL